MLLKEELAAIGAATDHYLFHDQLEESNEPLYFHEFIDRAQAAGLAYLADADLPSMFVHAFDAAAAAKLQRMPLLRREQYLDFLRGRVFRASVLHRAELPPDFRMAAPRLLHLHVCLEAPLEEAGTKGDATIWTHAGRSITTGPAMTAAVRRLRQDWPGWVAVNDLVGAVHRSEHQCSTIC